MIKSPRLHLNSIIKRGILIIVLPVLLEFGLNTPFPSDEQLIEADTLVWGVSEHNERAASGPFLQRLADTGHWKNFKDTANSTVKGMAKSSEDIQVSLTDFRLVAVISEKSAKAVLLVGEGGNLRRLLEGDEVVAGYFISEVGEDKVVLSSPTSAESVELELYVHGRQ